MCVSNGHSAVKHVEAVSVQGPFVAPFEGVATRPQSIAGRHPCTTAKQLGLQVGGLLLQTTITIAIFDLAGEMTVPIINNNRNKYNILFRSDLHLIRNNYLLIIRHFSFVPVHAISRKWFFGRVGSGISVSFPFMLFPENGSTVESVQVLAQNLPTSFLDEVGAL
uniref:Uncharacterized protein n=1 Tax=Tanacetum cinerariifolium TaxID=118510 RepID=A0A6L2NSG4_TANCI|nr:hypothetical protein [Tanacetum cinerariifolium]